MVKRNSYAPYGEAYAATVIDGTGYTGHVMDQATGLTYMQQRFYDPQIGRFLSVDPMPADPDSGANFSSYWYADNNPYRFTDPDGRMADDSQSRPSPLEGVPKPPTGCGITRSCVFDGTKWHTSSSGGGNFSEWIDGIARSINPFMPAAECKRDGCSGGGWVWAGVSSAAAGPGGFVRAGAGRAAPAAEKVAVEMGKKIEKLAGPEARRAFHDLKGKGMPDRALHELKRDAVEILEQFGVGREKIPSWLLKD